MTEQATITWHYLPELPPERRDSSFIVATPSNVTEGWYDGEGCWTFRDESEIYNVYAWAEWPAAPPVRET